MEIRCRQGRSALLVAVTRGASRVERLLLGAGANGTTTSKNLETVLHTAARADVVDVVILGLLMGVDM